jgi:hypothetical protein
MALYGIASTENKTGRQSDKSAAREGVHTPSFLNKPWETRDGRELEANVRHRHVATPLESRLHSFDRHVPYSLSERRLRYVGQSKKSRIGGLIWGIPAQCVPIRKFIIWVDDEMNVVG